MQITVQVDEVTLTTVIGDIVEYDEYDEDGDASVTGHKTVADLVATQIVDRLIKDADRWPSLRERVTQIRDEVIRERVTPSVEAALTRPIRKTNRYGEPTGAETTLSELIVDEARKVLTEPADKYRSEKGSVLQHAIRTEVKAAFDAEIAAAVKKAREDVIAEFRAAAQEQIAAAAIAVLAGKIPTV
jgi:hypothetical protein